MKIRFYFLIGNRLRFVYINAESEDEALRRVIESAEDYSALLYIGDTFIARKSEILGYGLA